MHDNDNAANDNADLLLGKPIDETDSDLCRALWLGVIIQAVIDARSEDPQRRRERAEARAWFQGGEGSDFAEVCDLVEIDFRVVRRRLTVFLADPSLPVDFRALKKARGSFGSSDSRHLYFKRSAENALARQSRNSATDSALVGQKKAN